MRMLLCEWVGDMGGGEGKVVCCCQKRTCLNGVWDLIFTMGTIFQKWQSSPMICVMRTSSGDGRCGDGLLGTRCMTVRNKGVRHRC